MSIEHVNEIRDDFDSYQKLINLYTQNKDSFWDTITLNLTSWFSANASSMLGAILTKFQDNLNDITINAGVAKEILERNGFLSFFGHQKTDDVNNTTIAYQVLTTNDDRF